MVRVPTASGRGKVVHFGDSTMQDFTQHKDTARRERYRSRHQRDNLDDPGSPGFWSWYTLWGQSSSISTSFADAARRAKRLGGARQNPDPLHERFDELCAMISTPAALVIDEETALAGRSRCARRAFAATDGDTVYVRPKLAAQPPERIDAVLMHELGHVILIRHGYDEHTERDCDECAEGAFGVEISYDADDVQTLGPGVRPRPAHLDPAVRNNPSPTKTLYRAAHDATVTSGTCFAQDIDDAIAYQDNSGFGGPNLYSLEVTPTYKTFVKDLEDARDQIADAIMKHGWPSGVRRPRELDDEVDLTKEGLVAWLKGVFSGYESGHAYVHDVVADTPWVVDLLGQSYDWVVFEDSFPEDCITWCYVGDDDLEAGMSLIA